MEIKEIQARKFNHNYAADGKDFILADGVFMSNKASYYSNNFLTFGPSDERQVLTIANILHTDDNLVINDTTGELYKYTNGELKKRGYKVYRLSFGVYAEEDVVNYNPLTFKHSNLDLQHIYLYEISKALSKKVSYEENSFWSITVKSLFTACFEYLNDTVKVYSFDDVYQLLDSLRIMDDFSDSPMCKYDAFKTILIMPIGTIRNIIIQSMGIIQIATIPYTKEIIKYNSIDMSMFCNDKIALFVDRPLYCDLIKVIRDQLFLDIIDELSQAEHCGRRTTFIFDRIQDIDLDRFISPIVCSKCRDISFWINLSNIDQLSNKIGESSKTLTDICNLVFLNTSDINIAKYDCNDDAGIMDPNSCIILPVGNKYYVKADKLNPCKAYKKYIETVMQNK